MVRFVHILLILAVAVDVDAQFFDFFSAFKPQTLRPIFEPTKPPRTRYESTERYQETGRIKTEHTTKSIRKTTKTTKQTKKSKIDNIIDDGRNTINYDNPKTYTDNPFERGVKPAVVNGPPITNKPPRPYVPRPIAGLDQNDDGSVTPELIIGPNEDYMTSVEKQRYIELAEKKCDEYISLSTVRVEAIPLVPSPSPVVVNVSSCARSIPLVVGGSVVTIQQFPHMALLGWTRVKSGGYSWKCGGSLVSERHVLTAAHCAYQERDDSVVIGPPRAVQLGSSQLDDPGAIVQRVASVTRHPKYRPPQSYNDIAIVTMTSAVTFSSAIRPACMGAPPAPGDRFIATGWGKTEFGGEQSSQLRGVSLSVWERSDCSAALGATRKLPRGPDTTQTCAGERDGGRDTCQGDSGGPAQVVAGCAWRVLAVTSAGRSCGAPGTPAIYANVPLAFVAKVAFGRSDQDDRQPNSNNRNTNSNNRRDNYDDQNNNRNSQRDGYNGQNSNSNRNGQNHNYNDPNSNRQRSDQGQQNSNSNGRQDDYNRGSSYNRENNYNQPNSNSNRRQNDNNQQNGYNRENADNQQYNNRRQSGYNQQNGYNRENDHNRQNSNNQQNIYDYQNSNSNPKNNNHNYNNQNSNNQQNQWNKRTTSPQWSYDGWNNNYNNPYMDTDGLYRRTDEHSTYRPQYYYSGLEKPYGDENIWRT